MSRIHSQADQLIPPHLIGLTRPVTHEEFAELCVQYPDLRLELTSSGELIVMPPTGSETGRRNSKLNSQLDVWASKEGSGITFSALAGFTLPNGAIRAPDVSWVRRVKWDSLTDRQKRGFAPICPDFVIELRSESDSLPVLLNKMEEYIENGATLAWLIDPKRRRVYVYKVGEEVVVLEDPVAVSGEPFLHGFELQLEEIW
jgi:Uma2 family endonuclease